MKTRGQPVQETEEFRLKFGGADVYWIIFPVIGRKSGVLVDNCFIKP